MSFLGDLVRRLSEETKIVKNVDSPLLRTLARVSLDFNHETGSKISVALSVLFVGGTGQISLTSVREAVAAGHKVTVFNRGKSSAAELPAGVNSIVGDIHDQASYAKLGGSTFDVVCAFLVYVPEQISQDIATFSGKVGQYIFISSASVYQKPARHYLITEKTPLENPYWEYSRKKIACERRAAGPKQTTVHHRTSEPHSQDSASD